MDSALIRLPTGRELREKRIELGMTQKEVAAQAGISQPLVARIEKGGVDPRLSTLSRLVDVLNATATERLPRAGDLIEGGMESIGPNESVRKAVKVLRERGFSQLPVIDKGKPVGIVSTHELVERVQSTDDPQSIARLKVHEVMGAAPPTVSPDTHFSTVENLLSRSAAVLVVADGAFVGIITKADLLQVL